MTSLSLSGGASPSRLDEIEGPTIIVASIDGGTIFGRGGLPRLPLVSHYAALCRCDGIAKTVGMKPFRSRYAGYAVNLPIKEDSSKNFSRKQWNNRNNPVSTSLKRLFSNVFKPPELFHSNGITRHKWHNADGFKTVDPNLRPNAIIGRLGAVGQDHPPLRQRCLDALKRDDRLADLLFRKVIEDGRGTNDAPPRGAAAYAIHARYAALCQSHGIAKTVGMKPIRSRYAGYAVNPLIKGRPRKNLPPKTVE